MKEKVWKEAMFWSLNNPIKFSGIEQCAQVADAILLEYEARFSPGVSAIPGFTLDNPPSFEDLLSGCCFNNGEMILDNMEDGNNVLEYTRSGCQDYAFHMVPGNLGVLKTWYEINQKEFLSDITESIKANDEL